MPGPWLQPQIPALTSAAPPTARAKCRDQVLPCTTVKVRRESPSSTSTPPGVSLTLMTGRQCTRQWELIHPCWVQDVTEKKQHRNHYAFPCSNVTIRVILSYLKNTLTTPSEKYVWQYPLPSKTKENPDLLNWTLSCRSRLQQAAEQGSLVQECGWFMVSHILMCAIIHLVLVPMNISS